MHRSWTVAGDRSSVAARANRGIAATGIALMVEDANDATLITVIDDLLDGHSTYEEFLRIYHERYGDSRVFANEDRNEFFDDVKERLAWSLSDADEGDRRDGYISVPEFIEWLSVMRSRYPAIDSLSSGVVSAQIDSESGLTSEEFEAQLIGLIDAYLAGNNDWASFSEEFVRAWRGGFAATRAKLAKLAASDVLKMMWGMFDAVMSPGRRTMFGEVLKLRKFATPGDVDEKARRWGWMTIGEATTRLRELRSSYREKFGV